MTAQSRTAELLAAALAYAEHGLRIVPGHEPLLDNDGNLTGCTCEAYKRSNRYRDWLRSKGLEKKFDPNYKCRTPGKHPRLSNWEAQASNDPGQIKAWWHKWPTANICFPPGINGFVTFDLDSYKDIYGDDGDLFTQADKDTVTQISGGGGEHLVFQMPVGKAYTNANNTLPPGIDIRGFGGQQLVEPSLHPSGNLYQWELGYSILERTPKPLPAALEAILDAAHQNSTPAALASFTTITTERPDLIRWRLSKKIRELINAPGRVGERSENDMKVCTALVYAGATADDILAVFQHYPIGTQGRYAESGDQYLARTIGKAQAFADAHPRPDVRATVDNLLLWARTHSFEPFIKPEFLASDGTYRTDSTDTKMADAVLCEMKAQPRLTIGKKRLAKLAGLGSCNTALNSLKRLDGWLFDVQIDPAHGAQISLDLSRLEQIDPLLKACIVYKRRDQSSENDFSKPEINEYSPRKTAEPFLTGMSKVMRERVQAIAQTLDIDPAQAKEEYTFAGLGESGLRVIDALLRAGDMTAQELADETGKKLSSIRTALGKLTQHGIVEAEREGANGPKVYSLAPDAWQRIEEIAPNLRTYGLVSRRENKRLEAAQQWCAKELSEAQAAHNSVQAQRLEQRFAKLAKQRTTHLARLHPDLSPAGIKRLAYEVAAYRRRDEGTEQAYRSQRRELQEAWETEHKDNIRMIRELAYTAMDEFAAQGLLKPTRRMIVKEIEKFGIFPENFISAVVANPKQMSGYRAQGGAV